MQPEKKKIIRKGNKIQIWVTVVILGGAFLFIITASFTDLLLKKQGKCAKGVLTDQRYYVKRGPDCLYYHFTYDGVTYSGNSQEEDFSRAGDSICVVYLEYFPGINRAMKYFEEGKILCQCQN